MPFTADAVNVQQVNARAQAWRQGDVVELDAVVWLADPALPLTEQSAAAIGDATTVIGAAADRVAIVSQTCDIVRDCSVRPFVTVAPVMRLEDPRAADARRGHRPRFAWLPRLGDNWFADLDLMCSLEKSLLVDAEPVRGLPDGLAQRRFALAVGGYFGRAAFPDDLHVALRAMVQRICDKHGRDSSEGRALAVLEEIRVRARPSWNAAEIEVVVLFAPGTREEADEAMTDAEWDDLVAGWVRRAEPFGVIASIDGAMVPLDELTAREYVDSDPLDLDHLTAPATSS